MKEKSLREKHLIFVMQTWLNRADSYLIKKNIYAAQDAIENARKALGELELKLLKEKSE